ncbi:MAG: site-2 protease family protein [Phycisphaeraceae bacterium]|nr:site-2 protease family protein [Phycisphaeraceae bacterium]
MSKYKTLIYSRMALLIVILVSLGVMVAQNAQTSWNIFLAVLGFSAVVFIHECGHFFVAKAGGIKVEAFSVFIPPLLVGIRRTEDGFRMRILPGLFPKPDDPDGNGLLCFTFGPKGKAGDTEYRIGLVPVAGYVKMLGQEDTGSDKNSSDPRSFGNRPIGIRMAVIVAGVTFNLITAVILMMILYSVGMPMKAPVVGGVMAGSNAEKAGLMSGDRIVKIDGKTNHIEYGDILIAAALSNKDQAIRMTVQGRDNTERELSIVAGPVDGLPVRLFGILPSSSLIVADIRNADVLYERTGLKPGDRIVAVAGQPVEHYWQLEEIIRMTCQPDVAIQVERQVAEGETQNVEVSLPLALNNSRSEVKLESELNHVCSLVPRLRITQVASGPKSLMPGDVVLRIGDVNSPTYKEMRDLTTAFEGQDLPIQVLREDANGVDQIVTLAVSPKRQTDSERVVIGVAVELDATHAVVAKSISIDGQSAPLAIPRGATITRVANTDIADFFDIIQAVKAHEDQEVQVHWAAQGQVGSVELSLTNLASQMNMESILSQSIPLSDLEEIHKAENLGEATVMGVKKCYSFVLQTYVTLRRLISRDVSLKAMSGPVGIATVTYQAVEQSFSSFLYLLAFISANLAVVNFLPIPVVDGGVFVLLIIEKIKGGPLSIRMQEIITYAGLALILSVFLYLTYNDIVRLVFG